jgi:Na+(H+)/acetate symporter ActP
VAINTLLVCGIYLTAQLVGAGSLIEALAGISFTPAVLICGIFMVVYVVFGGMLATTWVQIIKAGMLMTAGVIISVAVLAKFNFSPSELLNKAAAEHPKGKAILGPGTYLTTPALVISTGLTIFIGTAGLPHILVRFFTVPDSKAARVSVVWTISILALTWRRFNTTGALVGVAFGIVASVVMIVLSPPVWPGPDSHGSPSSLTFPGLVTIPIGFLGCWLGTMLGKGDSQDEYSFDELLVRSETGLGSEGGPALQPRGRTTPGVAAPAREPVA